MSDTQEHIDFFPGATKEGKLFFINGMLWLVRSAVTVFDGDESELGWNANNLAMNGAYHFFTETELKENQFVIKEF